MFTSLVFHGAYRRHDVRHRALFAAQLWTTVRNSCSRLELKWLNRTVAAQLPQKICRWLEPPVERSTDAQDIQRTGIFIGDWSPD